MIGLVAVMFAVGLLVGNSANQRPSHPAILVASVTIDPSIGETFAPAPQDGAPKLTAE
jgi:hypothetical protein